MHNEIDFYLYVPRPYDQGHTVLGLPLCLSFNLFVSMYIHVTVN